MSDKNIVVYKNFERPTKTGDYYRLLCMTGENKGLSYYLYDPRLVLGRGGKTDIQVLDNKSSREHAELKKMGENYIITDLNSHNGIVVNDVKVSQKILSDGDRIVIGKTVYKYNLIVIKDKDIALPNLKEELENLQLKKDEDIKKINDDEKKGETDNKSIKLPIILAALGMGYYLIMGDDTAIEKKTSESVNDRVESRLSKDFSENLRRKDAADDKILEEKMAVLIHSGLREHREENYFRAIKQFELALILSPSNGRAQFYLSRTKKNLDDEVEGLFLKANQDLGALKYKGASVAYCSILRLLQGYSNDERYKDAKEGVFLVEKNLGMEEGEIKCISSEN